MHCSLADHTHFLSRMKDSFLFLFFWEGGGVGAGERGGHNPLADTVRGDKICEWTKSARHPYINCVEQ